jgi:hypothetical protein
MAAAPLIFFQQAAGAAVKSASDSDSLQFVTTDGVLIECGISITATHNTNDAAQPRLSFTTGTAGGNTRCGTHALLEVVATYKDENGKTRSAAFAVFNQTSSGIIQGAYTAPTVTLTAEYFNCDPEQSNNCSVTVTASPK